MKAYAMYIGARNVDFPEKTKEDGTKMPARKGTYYSFFQNRWRKGELTENGMFVNMFVSADKEQPKLERGKVYEVDITVQDKTCTLYQKEEDEEFDD